MVIFAWRRLVPPFFIGGAEVSVRNLGVELVQAGFKVLSIGSYIDPRSGVSYLDYVCSTLKMLAVPYEIIGETIRYNFRGISCFMTLQEKLLPLIDEMASENTVVITAQEKSDEIVSLARKCGAVTVGWLHSASQVGMMVLNENPTYVLATSRFVASRAAKEFSRESIVFYPTFVNMSYVSNKTGSSDKFITLINPIPQKGVDMFLSLARRFPDRRFLAVEGWYPIVLPKDDLSRNVQYWVQQMDMTMVFSETRLLLVPSLVEEGFGRVVIEAGLFGVPALVSNSGGLIEAAGSGAGVIESRAVDVWARQIEILDNAEDYQIRKDAAFNNATRFIRDSVSELIVAGVLPGLACKIQHKSF